MLFSTSDPRTRIYFPGEMSSWKDICLERQEYGDRVTVSFDVEPAEDKSLWNVALIESDDEEFKEKNICAKAVISATDGKVEVVLPTDKIIGGENWMIMIHRSSMGYEARINNVTLDTGSTPVLV